jgi:prepilin-type N-terminal cleavage/methylation domain-containing protein
MFALKSPQNRTRKKAFTLVELMVSMAIIIFMLSIMSQAFVIATTCMSGLKGVGELLDKGRPVLAVLQKDLSAYHFDGYRRLSDDNFWDYGPPSQGYFQIYEGGASSYEGTTADGVTYQRSGSASDHRLAFTSRLSGKNPEDFYVTAFEQYFDNVDYSRLVRLFNNYDTQSGFFNNSSTLQTSKNAQRYDFTQGVLHSQWAEIAYFTKSNSRTANGTPLMDLYRQQRAVLPSNLEANGLSPGFPMSNMMPTPPYPPNTSKMPYYENFSCIKKAGNIYFNSPSDLTMPSNRMVSGVPNTLSTHVNSDLLITDVISFDVRILPDYSLNDFSLISALPYNAYRYSKNINTQIAPCTFDTWTTGYDGTTQYDIGDFSTGTGVWQPSAWDSNKTNYPPMGTDVNPATLIPIWGHNRSGMAGNIFTPSKGLRINAIQVSIRLWDEKSQKAREFKIIQRI